MNIYVKYKYSYKTENDGTFYMSKRHGSLLEQFTLCILPLHIETEQCA